MTVYTDNRYKRKVFRTGTSLVISLPRVFLKVLEEKAGREVKYFRVEVDDEKFEIRLKPILE